MEWTIICATNNEEILRNCLLSSPDIGGASEVILQTGYASAATAYNEGFRKARTDLVVFVHQDVYLPAGWVDSLRRTVETLATDDPQWGVLGIWGGVDPGDPPGFMYWTGVDGTAGKPFHGVREVRTLDEVVIITRKSSGLQFDERLTGFHMYGTDICLEARRRGYKSYIFAGFCVHNTNEYNMLPWAFWKSCLFIRRKWKSELPINTPCVDITWFCWPMIRWNLVRAANIILRRHRPLKRAANPVAVYKALLDRGLLPSSSAG